MLIYQVWNLTCSSISLASSSLSSISKIALLISSLLIFNLQRRKKKVVHYMQFMTILQTHNTVSELIHSEHSGYRLGPGSSPGAVPAVFSASDQC